jgi:hypothetical protein
MKFRQLFTLLLMALTLGVFNLANAQTVNTAGRASITIVPLTSLTLVTNPTWGTVTLPATGTTNYSMSTSTGIVTETSGTGFSFGDSLAGAYLVTGAASEPVTYSVSIGAFSGTGVTVVAPYINGTSSTGTGTLSALGTLTLSVGGVLGVASTATTGTQTATVTVTVDYS